MTYLYGASIQGIQGFIFETNVLKEIVGASELVEKLCTSEFTTFLLEQAIAEKECEILVGAAGNIRAIFQNKDALSKVVRKWPKRVMLTAPGITVSQATEKIQGNGSIAETMIQLEKHLKEQRNRAVRSIYPALMSVERCRRTGNPAIEVNKDGNSVDIGIVIKARESSQSKSGNSTIMNKIVPDGAEKNNSRVPFEIDDIVKNKESSWIAVIHIDGNSLGRIIQEMSSSAKADSEQISTYKDFSTALDAATKKAAQSAFGRVILNPHTGSEGMGPNKGWKYPIRPVILGGDDMTVICRADIAVDFTREFLISFEESTRHELKNLVNKNNLKSFKNGLTACAGIAFIKSSFPFHYAVDLAESLCGFAKINAKAINDTNVPSCLAFHKVQSSSVSDFNDIIKRELLGADGVSFNGNPYYLKTQGENSNTVNELLRFSEKLNEPEAPKSGIRQWLSLLYKDRAEAEQFIKRLYDIHSSDYTNLLDNSMKENTCLAYDWMTIANLRGGSK